jgi:putative ABC transport system substrate-binding protein
MTRRTRALLIALAVGLLVAPLAAAQAPAKIPRIGYLGDMPGPFSDAFREGLRERGYIEGQNLALEYRWAEGHEPRLPTLAVELIRLPVDILVTPGSQASRVAKHTTSTVPIVMAHVGDPVGTGLVGSLARPGANITGVSVIGIDTSGKRLELLKEAVPGISRVASLVNPKNPGHERSLRELHMAARALGVTLHPVGVQHVEELEKAFGAITTARSTPSSCIKITCSSRITPGSWIWRPRAACPRCTCTGNGPKPGASCPMGRACATCIAAWPSWWRRSSRVPGRVSCPWSKSWRSSW